MAITLTQELTINNFFEKAKSITIFKNGKSRIFKENEKEFKNIIQQFTEQTQNSVEMPAYAVSLHNETIKAINDGLWIQFNFEQEKTHREMPFDALLININKDYCGVNIIRHYKDKYEGRCFYLNLDNNLNDFYKFLDELIK